VYKFGKVNYYSYISINERRKEKTPRPVFHPEYIREGGCMWLIGIISIPSILMILL
tara:strand:+ start:360 stop:527 length:168 start_codon:yes stop_codon:yes gene_type:complete